MLIDRFSVPHRPINAISLRPSRFQLFKDSGNETGGTGSGAGKQDDPTDEANGESGSGTEPDTKQDSGNTPNPKTGGKPTPDPETGLITLTQDQYNKTIEERLKRDRDKRAKDEKDSKEQAERERLKAEQKFQELSETQAKRIAELEPKAEAYETLAEIVAGQMDAEIATWPKLAREAIPEGLTLEAKAAMIKSLRPLAKQLATTPHQSANPDPNAGSGTGTGNGTGTGTGTNPGNAPDPKPNGKSGDSAADEAAMKEHAKLYGRGI